MENVTVEVEYCNKCGYLNKYEELLKYIKDKHPNINIQGREGRRASFEVVVNGSLVHSKLQTLAYPEYDDLCDIISESKNGEVPKRICKQQPITSCSIS
ncbi:selenoprotein W [Sitophilus oryzae]|uniref:Migration and invasion enhancer 1 n=1 Tax=Sitophilus oryzae TaxID=7048 RepID=A0A6J2YCS3_SITOR|nr:selenoprotein W [Sitophilus oryzae]